MNIQSINQHLASIVHTAPVTDRQGRHYVRVTLHDGTGSDVSARNATAAQVEAAEIMRNAKAERAKLPEHPEAICGRHHGGSSRLTLTVAGRYECDGCGSTYTLDEIIHARPNATFGAALIAK